MIQQSSLNRHPPDSKHSLLQEVAQAAHVEAAKALADAKRLLLRTEAEASAAEADAKRRARDVEAKAAAANTLGVQAEEAKEMLQQAHSLAGQMRKSFLEEVSKVVQELRWVLGAGQGRAWWMPTACSQRAISI